MITKAANIDPPVASVKPSYEVLEEKARHFEAEYIKLRVEREARHKADTERGKKQYLKLKDCAGKAGVTYSTAHRYHKHGELDSYVIPGTSEIMAELNDMIARRTRTGRHAKGQPPS
jgi:hypothetical protein